MLKKLINKTKNKWMFMRKQYIYCNIEELLHKKESTRLLLLSFAINSIILMVVGLQLYFSTRTIGLSLMLVIMSVAYLFISLDFSNDINRINMWVYLKQMNGEE